MAAAEVKPGIYRHFKGSLYRVIGVAKHSETLEEMVVYEALYDNANGKFWVRPLSMWAEQVTRDGKVFFRFEFVEVEEMDEEERLDREARERAAGEGMRE